MVGMIWNYNWQTYGQKSNFEPTQICDRGVWTTEKKIRDAWQVWPNMATEKSNKCV